MRGTGIAVVVLLAVLLASCTTQTAKAPPNANVPRFEADKALAKREVIAEKLYAGLLIGEWCDPGAMLTYCSSSDKSGNLVGGTYSFLPDGKFDYSVFEGAPTGPNGELLGGIEGEGTGGTYSISGSDLEFSTKFSVDFGVLFEKSVRCKVEFLSRDVLKLQSCGRKKAEETLFRRVR